MEEGHAPPPISVDRTPRIIIGGKHKATVRYVGPVDGQEGRWVGLEWDEVSRGKHSGAYLGRSYFTSTVPGAASFVRYSSLIRHGVSTGIDLEDAVRTKYQDAIGNSLETAGSSVVEGDVRRIEEFLREEGALQVAGLSLMNISSVNSGVLFLRNVKELDLSGNLLSEKSWVQVLDLVRSLPRICVLNLSNNHLRDMFRDMSRDMSRDGNGREDSSGAATSLSDSLETLALNSCMISLGETVRSIGSMFPKLKELYLYDNKIQFGDFTPLDMDALEVLDLGQNLLGSWTDLDELLGSLPRLRSLSLEGNTIDTITIGTSGDHLKSNLRFPSLDHLNLARNTIKDWGKGIQALDMLPQLQELRFSENPVCDENSDVDRLIAVGRLGALRWVNGSEVTASERRDYELAFLRSLDKYVPSSGLQCIEERVVALEKAYSVPRNSSGGTTLPQTLEESMVCLELVSGSRMIVSKRVPKTLTLDKLQKVAERLLRGKSGSQDECIVVLDGVVRGPFGALFAHSNRHMDIGDINSTL
jgi:Leucine-rich repeat (LRR) protein